MANWTIMEQGFTSKGFQFEVKPHPYAHQERDGFKIIFIGKDGCVFELFFNDVGRMTHVKNNCTEEIAKTTSFKEPSDGVHAVAADQLVDDSARTV